MGKGREVDPNHLGLRGNLALMRGGVIKQSGNGPPTLEMPSRERNKGGSSKGGAQSSGSSKSSGGGMGEVFAYGAAALVIGTLLLVGGAGAATSGGDKKPPQPQGDSNPSPANTSSVVVTGPASAPVVQIPQDGINKAPMGVQQETCPYVTFEDADGDPLSDIFGNVKKTLNTKTQAGLIESTRANIASGKAPGWIELPCGTSSQGTVYNSQQVTSVENPNAVVEQAPLAPSVTTSVEQTSNNSGVRGSFWQPEYEKVGNCEAVVIHYGGLGSYTVTPQSTGHEAKQAFSAVGCPN